MKNNVKHIFKQLTVILLIVLFLYTSVNKLLDFSIFKEELGELPLPDHMITGLAITVIVMEFIASIFLAIPRFLLKGLYLSIGLLSIFTAYIIWLLLLNNGQDCGCGGIIELLPPELHIILNGAFITISVWSIIQHRNYIDGHNKLGRANNN